MEAGNDFLFNKIHELRKRGDELLELNEKHFD